MSQDQALARCLNIEDLRKLAQRRVPRSIYAHLTGAAEDELTLARNSAAFDAIEVLPNCLVDISKVETRTRILGIDLDWPLFCSPTGASRLFHAEGELAVARAAAATKTLYGLSTVATHSIEAVMAETPSAKVFQLFAFKDRELSWELIRRAKASGYKALLVTVDSPVRGHCEREMRDGVAGGLALRHLIDFGLHPRWSLAQARRGKLSLPIFAEWMGTNAFPAQSRYIGEQLDLSLTWKDIGEIVERWGGPLAIKGVMTAEDARRAVDVGASGIVVSNHGGRQLDGAAPSVVALPEIVDAVGARADVVLDGGIRRGVHILKALALGAKAVSIGRPYLFGLAAGGEAGVVQALTLLRTELVRAMQLAGCNDVGRLDRSLLRYV